MLTQTRPRLYGHTDLYRKKAKPTKHTFFSLLLSKCSRRVLAHAWRQIHQVGLHKENLFHRMCSLISNNQALTIYITWDKIKAHALKNKYNNGVLRDTLILAKRMESTVLKQGFSAMVLRNSRRVGRAYERIMEMRARNLVDRLLVFVKHRKKEVLRYIKASNRRQRELGRLKVILIVVNRIQKTQQQKAFYWLRLHRHKQPSKEHQELQLQLQDLQAQMQNKVDTILRLEEDLQQLRDQPNSTHPRIPSQSSFNNRIINIMSRDKSQEKRRRTDSDASFSSILGTLNRSRASSINDEGSCDCGKKYSKYKTLNLSLKSQISSLKDELEVAKSLNQNFTTQIQNCLQGKISGPDYLREIELKNELQTISIERDNLRERVTKYQKHVGRMTQEFKAKMEALYRKIKKEP